MVKMNYVGITDPERAFAELRPFRQQLLALSDKCRPFGTDYLILHAAMKALDTAAYHFTRQPDFYSIKPAQSRAGPQSLGG